ncbi:MAG: MBL fold metallo-hydrolase [Pseudomonadota bacterium]
MSNRPDEHGIVAIDVDYVRPGLAASHLIIEDGRAAFVDTGTTHSVPALLQAVADAGLAPSDVEYVFLTHIHLDHAGGAGELMATLPKATCIVHPRGARHLADPSRLIEGSIAVYGEAAFNQLYGEIVPIDATRIVSTNDGHRLSLGDRAFEFFHTEGHARHHHCIADSRSGGIFTGDSFGLSYRELDSERGPFLFPTSTPVHFDPDAAHASVDAIAGRQPRMLYLTHYSAIDFEDRFVTEMHSSLDAYVALTGEHGDAADAVERLTAALLAYLDERMIAHGVTLTATERAAVVQMDCALNAQGLVHWWHQKAH